MGQFEELHTVLQGLLGEVKTAAATAGHTLRVLDKPPVGPPELPCVYLMTPDSTYENMDINSGRDVVTVVARLLVDARRPQVELLRYVDYLIEVIDVWLRNAHPAPIDQARRLGIRAAGNAPVFNEIATRGADVPLHIELLFRPITPAP